MPSLDELIRKDPVVVGRNASLAEVATTMHDRGVRHLPMVDEDGVLVGLLHDADVFRVGALVGVPATMWVAYEPDDTNLKASDVARQDVATLAEGEAVAGALSRLLEHHVDALVVVDAQRRPVGMLTEHDVVWWSQWALRQGGKTIGDVYSRPALTVDVGCNAQKAFQTVVDEGVRHLLVLDDGKLYGVISFRDLLEDDAPRRDDLDVRGVVRHLPPKTTGPDEDLCAAATRFIEEGIGCLPVVDDNGAALGVLTRRDLVREIAQAVEAS